MTLEIIDTHCHLDVDYAPKSLEQILEEAKKEGVSTLISIGTDLETSQTAAEFSEKNPSIYHTVGFHPHEAKKMKSKDLKTIESMAKHSKCVAIGEIGLDYHYDHSPREDQNKRLKEQLELARKLELPVVIHSREAEEDLLKQLTEHTSQMKTSRPPGVIHCFSGTRGFAEACVDLGFYISFSGIITFKKAEDVRSTAKIIPENRLLVETDSPYLAPVPFRGKKCEPAMVKLNATKLAEIRGMDLSEIAKLTTKNAKDLFQI